MRKILKTCQTKRNFHWNIRENLVFAILIEIFAKKHYWIFSFYENIVLSDGRCWKVLRTWVIKQGQEGDGKSVRVLDRIDRKEAHI